MTGCAEQVKRVTLELGGKSANIVFADSDIEKAAETVKAKGGTVHAGPMEVPGGDRIIVASDPAGVMFGVVGPGD